MPITLPPISRRRFMTGSLAAGAAVLGGRRLYGAIEPIDPHRLALLADTHISGDRKQVAHGTNMYANMRQVCQELLHLDQLPAEVFFAGDCAYKTGETKDYELLTETLTPVREAGLPVHLGLGNHDHRGRFWQTIQDRDSEGAPVENRHLVVVETPRAKVLLLDSLDKTNQTPGLLGKPQLAWLAETLDRDPKKPTLIMVHHNLGKKPHSSGLTDNEALMEVILPRRHVKACIFGHTHVWRLDQRDEMHLINLPPVAYVFNKKNPSGWVDLHLSQFGATLQLHCIEQRHPSDGQKIELSWRS